MMTLQEAQALLLQRRAELGIKPTIQAPASPSANPHTTLPDHLGWHSASLTQHLRTRQSDTSPSTKIVIEQRPKLLFEMTRKQQKAQIPSPTSVHFDRLSVRSVPKPPHVRLHPSVAMAWLKGELVAPARVWLILRHLDKQGCGWLDLTAVRQHLTTPDSPFCLCGARQLRNILRAGEGLFWVRDGARLWLRGMKKMCVGLTAVTPLCRLRGQAVRVPLFDLITSHKQAKATFYASFHSSRNDHRHKGMALGKPISRDTLTDLFNISHNAQRRYEQLTGIQKQINYAVGSVATPESIKATAYQKGYAHFVLTDVFGQHGKPNQRYNAWQLPNRYCGPHPSASNGRKKQLNQHLKDLSHTGTMGNDERQGMAHYYDGKTAAKLHNRGHATDLYWSSGTSPYWYHLPATRNR